jgi:hypothetical protein
MKLIRSDRGTVGQMLNWFHLGPGLESRSGKKKFKRYHFLKIRERAMIAKRETEAKRREEEARLEFFFSNKFSIKIKIAKVQDFARVFWTPRVNKGLFGDTVISSGACTIKLFTAVIYGFL